MTPSYLNQIKNQFKSQRGSILLPIILVMLITTVMGVAIAHRAVSTSHQAGVLTHSDQAYHCAEAGIEESLEKLKAGDASGGSGTLQDAAGEKVCDFSYTVGGLGDGTEPLEFALDKDAVYQIALTGYSGDLDIFWGKGEADAALVVSVVKGSAAPYSLEKHAVNCGDTILLGNGFTAPSPGSGDYPCGLGTLSFSNNSPLLRIRALYSGTNVLVIPHNASFPPQGYEITSTGVAGNSERIVVATRSTPTLPAIFDYVLFSASETKPLEK